MVGSKSKKRQGTLPGLESEAPRSVAAEPRATVAREPSSAASNAAAAVEFPVETGPPPTLDDARIGLPDSLAGKSVYVVDSFSLIFQVFHAYPEMTGPRGEPVGAVLGFTRDMLGLLEQRKPDYLFCAFDLPGPTFRDELFDQYKAKRKEMPPDLRPQIGSIRRVLEAMEIPVLGSPGYEADDVLATVARLVDQRGGECFLVSGDKDCRQLITERVKIFNIRKTLVYDAAALAADWGVRPDQVVDFQALVGDSVDNVPGVPGVGPKTAREFLEKFGTLDNLLEHIGDVAGKKKQENLREHQKQALLSRQLVRLDPETPVRIDWPRGRPGQYDPARVAELFAEFGFHSLTSKMRGQAAEAHPAPAAIPTVYETIDSPERLRWLVEQMSRQPSISLDTETTSISPRLAELVGLSFSWADGQAYYLPVRGPAGAQLLDEKETIAALRPVLENPAIRKIGQNLKYDLVVLRSTGVEMAGVAFDSMLASYLLDAGERNHNLDELAIRYLNHTTTKISELIGTGKNQKRMDEVPIPQITHYAAEDADIVWRIRPALERRLADAGLQRLFETVEVPLIEVLTELEYNGIRVDVARLAELSGQYGEKLATVEQEIYALAGRKFNIGSPKQLQVVLFDELKLPRLRRIKTGASTDADVLEELARKHELPAKIVEYRQYAKLKNTYVDALPQLIHPATGRVHASFNQSVAATGRLSSSEPNLQNIPIRTREGREIRSAFLPGEPDWLLVAADYSQIELRVLAHLSGDATMRAAFDRDEDIHARVASEVYGVGLDAVTPEMRRVAKAVNFGVIYGQSPFGLSKMLGIDQQEATEFIRAYFAGYPGISQFLETILAGCLRDGYVSTILGRRRSIRGVRPLGMSATPPAEPESASPPEPEGMPDAEFSAAESGLEWEPNARGQGSGVRGQDDAGSESGLIVNVPPTHQSAGVAVPQRNLAERTAINTVIQGSAADLIKLAMINIHRRLRSEHWSARMLLQIHDELVLEAPPAELDRFVQMVRSEMSGVMQLSVPLKVDVKTGTNWADCEPWGA
jgi:DNA polymerase I